MQKKNFMHDLIIKLSFNKKKKFAKLKFMLVSKNKPIYTSYLFVSLNTKLNKFLKYISL